MNPNSTKPASLTPVDSYFEEVQSKTKFSFDFILWIYRILKYWYLFVLSVILFMGYAYIKNKAWIPTYRTSALLMMESRGNIGVAMGAVPMGSIVRNSVNQQMVLQSYDMTTRTVDRLPQMRVDYFIQNKFNINNLYGQTPIVIESQYVAPDAYSVVFNIAPIDTEKCRIYYDATETVPAFSMEVPYGQYIQEHRFYIRINKTDRFSSNGQFTPFSFRFVSKGELTGRYSGRVSTGIRSEGSSALVVSIVGSNPAQDKDFLNALLTEFQDYNLALKNEAADRSIEFIDKQILIIQDSLDNSEFVFRDFQEKTGMYKIESDQVNREMLTGISESLGKLKADENSLLLITEEINKSILENKELLNPTGLGVENPSLAKYVEDYNNLIKSHQSMGEAHPFYKKNEQTINAMRIKILEELRTANEKMQASKEGLQVKSREVEARLVTLPSQEREFLRYEREYKINETYHTYLLQKKREANIQKASNIPDNYVLEEPRLASGPTNGDAKTQTYFFFFCMSLVLPLAFVICKEEVFNFAIATKEECERISGLPVIGTIENVSKKMTGTGGAALVKNYPKSSFAESFRNMRIRIEYMAQRESSISVLLTSAEPADGKTFVAANIASIYQLTGKRVILVDFDLRRPSVSRLLNIQSKKGVSNFLIGQVTLDEVVLTHPEYGFDVIPAGTLPPNPSELIKTKRTKDLLDYLHSKYDYVVVDCSPVGLVSDAYILSKLVDTTLFVIRRGKTNRSFFKSVIQQVKSDDLFNVALVFNDVKGREGYYGTSRYYGDKTYYLKRNSYYHDDYFEK